MSDSVSLKTVSRHLPLLRAPLLLNNIICLALSGICSHNPIYQAQLALISISFLIGFFDLVLYNTKKRAATRPGGTRADRDVHGSGLVAAADGVLSVGLLVIWIIGIVAFTSWDGLTSIIATFGAFLAWSFHFTSFCVQTYIWVGLGRTISRCPNCDHDLSTGVEGTHVTDFGRQNENQVRERGAEPDTGAGSSAANEYDEAETDCLILRDGEDKS